jgi:hypothetical protein
MTRRRCPPPYKDRLRRGDVVRPRPRGLGHHDPRDEDDVAEGRERRALLHAQRGGADHRARALDRPLRAVVPRDGVEHRCALDVALRKGHEWDVGCDVGKRTDGHLAHDVDSPLVRLPLVVEFGCVACSGSRGKGGPRVSRNA